MALNPLFKSTFELGYSLGFSHSLSYIFSLGREDRERVTEGSGTVAMAGTQTRNLKQCCKESQVEQTETQPESTEWTKILF